MFIVYKIAENCNNSLLYLDQPIVDKEGYNYTWDDLWQLNMWCLGEGLKTFYVANAREFMKRNPPPSKPGKELY